MKGNNQ